MDNNYSWKNAINGIPITPWTPRYRSFINKVIVTGGINTVGYLSFSHLNELETVILSADVKVIYDGAFMWCPNLKNIDMSQLRYLTLHNNFIYGCKELKYLSFPDKVTTIGRDIFAGSNLLEIKCNCSTLVDKIKSAYFTGLNREVLLNTP